MKAWSKAFLALALFSAPPAASAIEPDEVMLTLHAALERPIGPAPFDGDFFGPGFFVMAEKAIGKKYSLGLGLSQVSFRNPAGRNVGMGSLDLVVRRFFEPWHSFNPYVLLGFGANIYRDSLKDPFGDVFHGQAALGSQFVFDSRWALDYALDWHCMAPLTNLHHFAGARIGLNYRFGGQAKVNNNAAAPLQMEAVETLNEELVRKALAQPIEVAPEPVEPVKQVYRVKEGDSLYRISAKQRSMGNPNLWPLVFEDNRGQIQDPNLIKPNQELLIRSAVSESEAREAIQKTRMAAERKSKAAAAGK